MSNLKQSFLSWKTTLLGFIPIILSLLIMLGVVSVEDQAAIQQGVNDVFANAEGGLDNILALISGVLGLIGVFSKDGDK